MMIKRGSNSIFRLNLVRFDFCCALLVLLRSEERWGRY